MKSFSFAWIAANALAFAVGFALFLFTTERMIGENMNTAFFGHFIGLLLFGAFLAFVQSLVIRRLQIATGKWILSGIVGFVLVMAVIWPLYLTKIWPADGPFEPIVISFTACFFLGLMLFILYKKQLAGIGKFFLWWVVGTIVGIALSAALIIFIVSKMGLPFVIEMAIFTLIIGLVAGLISSRSVRNLTARPDMVVADRSA
ncbi:MAG: hypothetical protein ABR502_11455 [Chitinophagaceae bacterium]